jgi:chromosome segregation ATPase
MDENRALLAHARLVGIENLSRNDKFRVKVAEENERRALVQAEEQRALQQTEIMLATSDEHARLQDELATLRSEIDGLRNDIVSGLKAVGESFDQISEVEASHGAESDEQLSTLRNELAAARAEGMERTAKATIAFFTEIAAQRAAIDRVIETEREKNSQTLSLAAEREEKVRTLQDEVSALRNELTVVRVEAAGKLAAGAKATLESFNEVAAQRAAVARLIDANREEMDSLNARTLSLMADMKALKEASENFKFAREKDDETLDVPAFLPTPERSVN